MTIVLVDHDKWLNSGKNFSFKSMIAQFDDKKRKFENNSEFQKELKKCAHCEQRESQWTELLTSTFEASFRRMKVSSKKKESD